MELNHNVVLDVELVQVCINKVVSCRLDQQDVDHQLLSVQDTVGFYLKYQCA